MTVKLLVYINFIIAIILQASCTDKVTPIPDYFNTCNTSGFFTAGVGYVYIPTAFSPNGDCINDVFDIVADSNIKCITNLYIRNKKEDVLFALDTILGSNKNGNWNGMLNNTGTFHEGYASIICTALDKFNNSTILTASTCSYNCANSNVFTNRLKCKTQDQWNGTDTVLKITKDNCFK
jgi:hypothetical protein